MQEELLTLHRDLYAVDSAVASMMHRPATSPASFQSSFHLPPVRNLSPRDIVTPSWSHISWGAASTCSARISALATPRTLAASFRTDLSRTPTKGEPAPIIAWGRHDKSDGRRWTSAPERLGDASRTPRSVDPDSWDNPVVLTSPKLSPRYRVPQYIPKSSRAGSPPPQYPPISPRCPMPPSPDGPHRLNHTRTKRVIKAESPGKHLYDAVRNGQVEEMRRLIKSGADVDHRGTGFNNTALHTACTRGTWNAVRALIAGGADVDALDKFGSTPLHYASRGGHLQICELLVAAGAKHNIANKYGKTAWDWGKIGMSSHVVTFLEILQKADDSKNSIQVITARSIALLSSLSLRSLTHACVVSTRSLACLAGGGGLRPSHQGRGHQAPSGRAWSPGKVQAPGRGGRARDGGYAVTVARAWHTDAQESEA